MVTNKFLSSTMADALLADDALKQEIIDLTGKKILIIEGLNLQEFQEYNADDILEDYGVVITNDPIGREDSGETFTHKFVVKVDFILSSDMKRNTQSITETENRKVYAGLFMMEDIVVRIIKILYDTEFGRADLQGIDYEMPPITGVSNSTIYTTLISLNFNIGRCMNG